MLYNKNFISTLNDIFSTTNSRIAKIMIDTYLKDLDIVPYFIDLSDKVGMIKFLPKKNTNDLMFNVIDGDIMSVLSGHPQIVQEAFGIDVARRVTSNIDIRKPFKFKKSLFACQNFALFLIG